MPIRNILASFLIPIAFLADPSLGTGFPLQDYVPADFHRHYLSIAPHMAWSGGEDEDGYPESDWERSSRSSSQSLSIRHGSERYTQWLRWSAGSGADFRRDGRLSVRDNAYRYSIGETRSSHRDEGAYLFQSFHSHLAGQWFFLDRLFLSASMEPRLSYQPWTDNSGSSWSLTFPASSADSADFNFSEFSGSAQSLSTRFNGRLAFGYGRIQDVRFAERALFLLDRIGSVTGREIRLSPEDIRDLEAHVEARRKLRPFYDARLASIHDLESVDLFVRQRAGLGALPARAILEIADEWNHSGRHRRESGWEARIQPFLAWSWEDYEDTRDEHRYARTLPLDSLVDGASLRPGGKDTPFSTNLDHGFRSFREDWMRGVAVAVAVRRPWRRFFQLDAGGHGRYALISREIGESRRLDTLGSGSVQAGNHIAFEYPRLETGWEASASFYPNTRTAARAALSGEWSRSLDYSGSKESLAAYFGGTAPMLEAWASSHRLRLDTEYFLGHRLGLRASATGVLDWRYLVGEFPGYFQDPVSRNPSWRRRALNRYLQADAGLVYYLF